VAIPYRHFGTLYRSYLQGSRFPYRRFGISFLEKSARNYHNCAVVSLKPGHMDWVRDFNFKLAFSPCRENVKNVCELNPNNSNRLHAPAQIIYLICSCLKAQSLFPSCFLCPNLLFINQKHPYSAQSNVTFMLSQKMSYKM